MADAEAERISTEAVVEARATVDDARARAEEIQGAAAEEASRLALLHTALADAEIRFRRLAATAANEIGTLTAIADQDVDAPPPAGSKPLQPEPRGFDPYLASVDLTVEGLVRDEAGQTGDDSGDEEKKLARDPDVTFYQRRLAGLRERLEQSGHPPS